MSHNLFGTLPELNVGTTKGKYYALPALEKAGLGSCWKRCCATATARR